MLCQYKCEQLDTVSWEYVQRNCSLMTISGNETPGPKFMPVTSNRRNDDRRQVPQVGPLIDPMYRDFLTSH